MAHPLHKNHSTHEEPSPLITKNNYRTSHIASTVAIVITFFFVLTTLTRCPGPAPSEGRYLDVGGYYIFHWDTGVPQTAQSGDPTVIFLSGLGLDLSTWDKVRPDIAQFARTLSYDRAGTGHSDEGPNPRTGSAIIKELRTLLDGTQIPSPYILVAHSAGGMYARLFANAYPEQIAGILLIDTRHEDADMRQALSLSPQAAWSLQNRERLAVPFISSQSGALGEYLNFANTGVELHSKRELPDVPLIFLGRDRESFANFLGIQVNISEAYDLQLELAKEQVRLVPKGEYREVTGASHVIQQDKPEAVIQAVHDIFTKVTANKSRNTK